jgi:histone H2A
MSAKGKAEKAKGISSSTRAGIVFPVGRTKRQLHDKHCAPRISDKAGVYLAAVLEYLVAEVVEASGNVTTKSKKSRIAPRHIQVAIRRDPDLCSLLGQVNIVSAGVVPSLQAILVPPKPTDGVSRKKPKSKKAKSKSKSTTAKSSKKASKKTSKKASTKKASKKA